MVSGNFIVVGQNAANIVEGMSNFVPSGPSPSGTVSGPYVAGVLNNRYTVIKNLQYPADEFVVGFKGSSYLYSGYIWAPYRPLYTTPPIILDDFIGRRGLYTSGGKKMINSKFYSKGTITNFS